MRRNADAPDGERGRRFGWLGDVGMRGPDLIHAAFLGGAGLERVAEKPLRACHQRLLAQEAVEIDRDDHLHAGGRSGGRGGVEAAPKRTALNNDRLISIGFGGRNGGSLGAVGRLDRGHLLLGPRSFEHHLCVGLSEVIIDRVDFENDVDQGGCRGRQRQRDGRRRIDGPGRNAHNRGPVGQCDDVVAQRDLQGRGRQQRALQIEDVEAHLVGRLATLPAGDLELDGQRGGVGEFEAHRPGAAARELAGENLDGEGAFGHLGRGRAQQGGAFAFIGRDDQGQGHRGRADAEVIVAADHHGNRRLGAGGDGDEIRGGMGAPSHMDQETRIGERLRRTIANRDEERVHEAPLDLGAGVKHERHIWEREAAFAAVRAADGLHRILAVAAHVGEIGVGKRASRDECGSVQRNRNAPYRQVVAVDDAAGGFLPREHRRPGIHLGHCETTDREQVDIGEGGNGRRLVARQIKGDKRVIRLRALGSRIDGNSGGGGYLREDRNQGRHARDGGRAAIEREARDIVGTGRGRIPRGFEPLRHHFKQQIGGGIRRHAVGNGRDDRAPAADGILSVDRSHTGDAKDIGAIGSRRVAIIGGVTGGHEQIVKIGFARTAGLDFVGRGARDGLPREMDRAGRERDRGQAARNRQRRQIALVNLEAMRRKDVGTEVAKIIRGLEMKRQILRLRARIRRHRELGKPGVRIAGAESAIVCVECGSLSPASVTVNVKGWSGSPDKVAVTAGMLPGLGASSSRRRQDTKTAVAGGTGSFLMTSSFGRSSREPVSVTRTGTSPVTLGPRVSITAEVVSVTVVPRLPAASMAEKTGLTTPEAVEALIENTP